MSAALVWFRSDLRLHDHPALTAAAAGHRVLALFVWDGSQGGAAQCWLRAGLESLRQSLEAHQVKLLVLPGPADQTVPRLARACAADTVFATRRWEPRGEAEDHRVAAALQADGKRLSLHRGALLYDPDQVAQLHGRWAEFFSPGHDCWGKLFPFWRACLALGPPDRCLPAPGRIEPLCGPVDGLDDVVDTGGEHEPWRIKLSEAIGQVSERRAREELAEFVAAQLRGYERKRHMADLLDAQNANSGLSAYLRWGQLSARELYWAVEDAKPDMPKKLWNTFARRVFWRDHAYYQLWLFRSMPDQPIRPAYRSLEWRSDSELLEAWQKGRTGFPLVDAAMRELWARGRMQQNMRMVAAAFLVEYLRISWVEGRKWFDDTLVDADEAINAMMWQSAGRTGADQWTFSKSPSAGEAVDHSGRYVHRWVPELSGLPAPLCHRPWEADSAALEAAGVELGGNYPHRCVCEQTDAFHEAVLRVRQGIAHDAGQNSERGYDMVQVPGLGLVELGTEERYRITAV